MIHSFPGTGAACHFHMAVNEEGYEQHFKKSGVQIIVWIFGTRLDKRIGMKSHLLRHINEKLTIFTGDHEFFDPCSPGRRSILSLPCQR